LRRKVENVPGHYTVGLVAKGKADRVAVVAEDALIAALRVKAEHPDATITYVRRQNRRGDARHPLSHPSRQPPLSFRLPPRSWG
jgi:hypothetical protein